MKDKGSSKNPNKFNLLAMSEKGDKSSNLFPLIKEQFTVTKPRVNMQDGDGDGFSVVIIQGFLRTK